jgi:hypothetical protein
VTVAKNIINDSTTIEYVRVDSLVFDPAYQRGLDERRAAVIAAGLDTGRIGVIVVSHRADDTRVVVDGQHRCQGIVLAGRGHELVRCEVHRGLSASEEAALFLKLNGGRKKIGALDEFKAALAARVPWAVEVNSIASGLKLRIATGNARRTVQAVQAVKGVHLRHRNLARTLSVLADWDDASFTFQGDLMRAVAIFIAHHDTRDDSPGVDDRHLVRSLKSHDPEVVIAAIKRRSDGHIIKRAEAACSVLQELYNKRLSSKSRLPPYIHRGPRAAGPDDAEA